MFVTNLNSQHSIEPVEKDLRFLKFYNGFFIFKILTYMQEIQSMEQNNRYFLTPRAFCNLFRTRQVWDVWALQNPVSTDILDLIQKH
jgi:hypothetical protein